MRGFLNSKGLVIGIFLAWVVTFGEIIFGTLITIGYKVKYCVIINAIVVTIGIFLMHLPNGRFSVGHGSGGVEYSLVLLAVLIYLYSAYSN
ncbi:DoxX family protein [Rhodohalobacter sp. SW132]|uniref:DoxX family protein n=1 Tax=Rhodohalobacter sp. SW132 TaxID=2293433 RepID=UPI00351905D4